MSTKTGASKGKQRDRPKSNDKKDKKERGDNKSSTPTNDGPEERAPSVKSFIWNEEIEALKITQDNLAKTHSPRPPSGGKRSPSGTSVHVRKMKPPEVLNRPKPRTITIAKPAPMHAPVKPMDYSGAMGPRFDGDGKIIPHSILGSVEEFMQEAHTRGEFVEVSSPPESGNRPMTPSVKYGRRRVPAAPRGAAMDEKRALGNWVNRMKERRHNQNHISRLLGKPSGALVMNRAEQFRRDKEEQHLIDRTIPLVDYGKGYRVGSEFWKQQEQIGDDMSGIHMSVTQTEAGFAPPIEHIGLSDIVKGERGIKSASKSVLFNPPRTPLKPWHRTQYLRDRKEQLQPYIDELSPYRPDFDGLAVVGCNEPLGPREAEDDDVMSESGTVAYTGAELDPSPDMRETTSVPELEPPVLGPSLDFAGEAMRWLGDSHSNAGEVGAEARVVMETTGSRNTVGYMDVKNDGSTAIYFKWKKLAKDNPFDLVHANVQRFYFDTSGGVILPGDTTRFPFVFKSPGAGVFLERWQFETQPVLAGGAALVVALRGCALQEDTFLKEREALASDLRQRKAEGEVRGILYAILDGMRTPERARSPVDCYLTEEEKFSRNNPSLKHSHEPVEDMMKMYTDLCPEEADDPQWDHGVHSLTDMLMSLDEDDERKEAYLGRMNDAVASLSYPPGRPLSLQLHEIGYALLGNAVDDVVSTAMQLRANLGLPENDEYYPDDPNARARRGARTASSIQSRQGTASKDSKPSPSRTPSQAQLKVTPTTAPRRTPKRTARSNTLHEDDFSSENPATANKYKERLYTQTYQLVGKLMDDMDQAFQEARLRCD